MSKRYFMKWEPSAYRNKTAHLTDDEDLFYRRLIDAYWMLGGLPSDMDRLRRISRYERKKFNQVVKVVLDFFIIKDDKLCHKRLDDELAQLSVFIEEQRERGRRGGLAKAKANAIANATKALQRKASYTDTDTDIKEKVEKEKLSTDPKPKPAVRSDERSTLNFEKIEGLDLDAWQEWTAYRSKMKFKKYKTTAKAKELAKLTHEQQLACIEHSIGNQYQGLFPGKFKDVPKVSKGNGKWNDPPPRAQPPDVHGKPLQYNTPFTETEKKNAKAMIAKARQKIGTKKPKPEPQPHEEKPQPSQQSNQQPTMAQLLRAAKSCYQAWDVLEESCGRTWEQAQSDKHHKCFHCSIFEKQRNAAPAKKVKTVGDLL